MVKTNNSEDKRILNSSYQPNRGPGLPAGTHLIIWRVNHSAYEIDYTTPYGAYGQFVANQDDILSLQCVSRSQ